MLCMCVRVFVCFFSTFFVRNTIKASDSLDLVMAQHFVGPDLRPDCLQVLSADGTSRQSKEEGKDQQLIQSSTTPDPGHHVVEQIKLKKERIWISTAVVMLLLNYIKIRFTDVCESVIILFADTLMQFILSILVCFHEAGY